MESNQLLEIIYLLEDSYIGEYVRGSLWLFPVIQSFHLIGLGILGAALRWGVEIQTAQQQQEAIDNDLMKESDPSSPMLNPQRSSKVTFGGGQRS